MDNQVYLSRNLLMGEMLASNARKYPGKLAFKEGDRSITYSQANCRVNKLANAFSNLGIRHGDKVAVLLYNSIEYIDCFFGLNKLGVVPVLVNYRLVGPEIVYILDNSDSVALVFDSSFEKVIASIKDQLPKVRHFIAVPNPGESSWALNYDAFLETSSGEEPLVRVSDNDPALIMYTSGTTGKPKGAVLTHKNLFSNMLFRLIERPMYHEDIYLCIPPLFHVAALASVLNYAFLGAGIIIHRNFDAKKTLEDIEREKVTVVLLVPAMWNLVLQQPDLVKYDLSSIRAGNSGGALMPLSLRKRIYEAFPGIELSDSFGQTEMSPVTTMLKHQDYLRKPTSVGKPILGTEVRVVDDDGRDIPVGEVGEIVYRGPSMFLEYYNNPKATKEAIVDGWFHSGDLVRMDEEGFIYVVDRKKDMIKTGGENVYSAEVEDVLSKHEKILEAAVIGVPHKKWGEGVHAVVVVKPGQILTQDEVISFCAERMAGYKKPRSVEFLEALPRNATGKVLKMDLRKKHGEANKYI